MDKPARWFYLVAVFFALMPNMDRLTATPIGAGIWYGALFAFSWPIIRFGRAWLAVPIGALVAGLGTYALHNGPTLAQQTQVILMLVVSVVMVGLGYVVLWRGQWNPYKTPRH